MTRSVDLPIIKKMKVTQHLLVSGVVQGVSFRYFTQSYAQKIGVTGWVRNLSDGRVEAIVQGAQEQLDELHKALLRGPPAAKVRGIEVQVVVSRENMKEFKIAANGEKPCLER